MIHIGIDAVEVERFDRWKRYTKKQLERILSISEIEYCLRSPEKANERFAARFAAKEAFFKALFPLLAKPLPFLSMCKLVAIETHNGIPQLHIMWKLLKMKPLKTALSITHTRTTAVAVVLLY